MIQGFVGGFRAAAMLALIMLAALAVPLAPARAQNSTCATVPGTWSWFANGNVTFYSNGTLTQGQLTGRWFCLGSGTVRIEWANGYVDAVGLYNNGTLLSGTNQQGQRVTGQRLSGGGGGTGHFQSRWDQIGGSWTTGWVPNHTSQYCGHGTCQACPGVQSPCGHYPNGAVITVTPYGARGDCSTRWQLRCTSMPQ